MFQRQARSRLRLALLCAAAALPAAAAIMVPNTGAGITPGEIDPNWTIVYCGGTTASCQGNPANAYVTVGSPSTFPFGSWAVNNGVSQWISPQASYGPSDSAGVYRFRLVFQAPRDVQNGWLQFRTMADNAVLGFSLNGSAISGGGHSDFRNWSAYQRVDGGLVTGANTLDFFLRNDGGGATGNPAGLRVELEANTPEPASMGMLGLGMVGLAAALRRRTAK